MASGIQGGFGQMAGAKVQAHAAQAHAAQAQYFGDARNSIQPVAPVSPMTGHAERLHKLAEELQQFNNRLTNAIDRITGPIPEAVGNSKDLPDPGQGSLLVAQFGAERISLGVDRLAELITRLEGIM